MTTREYWARFESPIGPLTVRVDANGALVGIDLDGRAGDGAAAAARCARAVEQLQEYFAGRRRSFDLPLRMSGTDFQRRVWQALRRIPFGERLSYAGLAQVVGRPGAARAVGQANGANPIPIVVPCHRVVASDGGLGGFSGGLAVKRWLLDHEGALAARR